MTARDKLREFAEIVYNTMNPILRRDKEIEVNGIISTVTAIISEYYVPKEEYEKRVQESYNKGYGDGVNEMGNLDDVYFKKQ